MVLPTIYYLHLKWNEQSVMSVFYNNEQIRQLETLAIASGISAYQLMQEAGQAAFTLLQQIYPEALKLSVICGAGNNAGDGFEVARLAHQKGLCVTVHTMRTTADYQGAAQQALQAAQQAGVTIIPVNEQSDFAADLIVDALLGSGLKGEISPAYQTVIERINHINSPVVALDVPSGIDVDSGDMHGCAVQAEVTITFIGYKQGLFTRKGPGHCGELYCDNLQLPQHLLAQVKPAGEILNSAKIKHWLPPRERDANKGDYGHVLVIGGDYGMGGAVRMASEAAMRVGAGLVTVATRPEHVTVVAAARPEIMCHQVQQAADLEPLLKRATFIVIGPGLGKSDWARTLLAAVLNAPQPKLLDADAVNLIAEMNVHSNNWVLTPHPGEAARLLHKSCQEIQFNRFESIIELQQR